MSIWSMSLSVQVPEVVAHHSNAWLSLVTCFIPRNVLVHLSSCSLPISPKLSGKKSKSVKMQEMDFVRDMTTKLVICNQHVVHNIGIILAFFSYIENCVSLA